MCKISFRFACKHSSSPNSWENYVLLKRMREGGGASFTNSFGWTSVSLFNWKMCSSVLHCCVMVVVCVSGGGWYGHCTLFLWVMLLHRKTEYAAVVSFRRRPLKALENWFRSSGLHTYTALFKVKWLMVQFFEQERKLFLFITIIGRITTISCNWNGKWLVWKFLVQ